MLKRASFLNFKSFADEVQAEFAEGITAIIGPNGCGKSNINDGIRWVLGSQSAKDLRGGKMEDVIFNGNSRRPKKNEAEVTLVLDNSKRLLKGIETEEVSVTRRIIRGKGSEYAINGEPARLKDVQDLFLDTGIGSNSYSIIGQGQVNKILSTKLEERRAIFEEAAGIVKLKQQKEQTEKRLAEITANVARYGDIVREVEKQLKPLKKQAEQAKAYAAHADALEAVETQYLLHEADQLRAAIEATEDTLAAQQTQWTETETVSGEKEELLTLLKERYQEENESLFTYQQKLAEEKEDFEKLNGTLKVNEERIQHTEQRLGELATQLEEIETTHSLSIGEFQSKQERSRTLATLIQEAETKLAAIKAEQEETETQKMFAKVDLEQARQTSSDTFNELNQEKFQYETAVEREQALETERHQFQEKLDRLTEEAERAAAEEAAAERALEEASAHLASWRQQADQLQQENKVRETTLGQLRDHIHEREREEIRLRSKVESLEALLANNELFYDGVKAVLNEAKGRPQWGGVHGTVADLVSVDAAFETALENLLQGTMQFIVTEDDGLAADCIRWLKDKRLGRATFLPLNTARTQQFTAAETAIIDRTEGIQKAEDAIQCDKRFQNVMSAFVGRALFANTLDQARAFMKQQSMRCKIVTLDGEVVQAGTLSGGRSKQQRANFFTRRREFEEAKERLGQLATELQTLLQQLKETEETVAAGRQEETAHNQQYAEITRKAEETRELATGCKQRAELAQIRREEAVFEEKERHSLLQEVRKKVATLSLSIEQKEKRYQQSLRDMDTLNDATGTREELLRRLEDERTELRLHVSQLTSERTTLEVALSEYNDDQGGLEERIKGLQTKQAETAQVLADYREHQGQLQADAANRLETVQAVERTVAELRGQTTEAVAEIETLERTVEEFRVQKERLAKQISSAEVQIGKKETALQTIEERFFDTYEKSADEMADIPRQPIDVAGSKEEINRLKKEIAALGTINHASIEDCRMLEERYKTEKAQMDDIQQAKDDVSQLLESVKADMIHRFTTTFAEIADHFARIFQDLFGGGKAKLSLVDPKDPLASAIEIVAQPPGKKPQTIDSLSGGEKAFTAVALIFAIITTKPSPFIILDEVDAPLDDANVARFAAYLKQFKEKSQFIIVTHRNGTMQAADRLFGVTQEELGVTILFPHTLDMEQKSS